MADDVLQVGRGDLVFADAVVKFGDFVVVVGDVRIERPGEVTGRNDRARQVQLDAAVHHRADVVPAESEAAVRVRLRDGHEHVARLLVVELQIGGEAVPESEVQAEVRGPRGFPAQLLVALRVGGYAGGPHVFQTALDQREVLVVGDRGVARRTGRNRDLGVGQPFAGVLQETLVAHVPHEARRPEYAPAVRGSEARRGVGAEREVGVVAVREVVFAAAEEGEEAVVVVRLVLPRRGAGSGRDAGQLVVVLSLRGHAERFVVVVDAFLSDEEVERMVLMDAEAVVHRIGDRERQAVGGVPGGGSDAQVGIVFGVGDSEARGVGVVRAELRFDRQSFDWRGFGEERGDDLVLLVVHGVVLDPLQRVLAFAFPTAVLHRGDRTVRTAGIPVGHHEAGGRNRRHDRVFARLRQFDLLVVEQGVGPHLEPLGGALFDVGAERIAAEVRTGSDAFLVVVASRNVVVRLFGGSRDREFVVLEQGVVAENLVEPVHVGLAQQGVVLAFGQPDLLFVLDALGGVHQVPVAVGELRDTELHAVVDDRTVGHAPAFGRDDHHAVGGACAVDRGRGGVLEDGEAFDVGRIDRIEIRRRDHDAVEDEERVRAGVDRVRAADGQLRRLARLARAGEYREARNLPLQRLVEGGRGRGLDLFRLYGRDRSGDGSLFTHAVGDDHHVLERLRIALHFEVAGHLRPSVGDRVLHGLVTDVLEGQRGPGCDLNGIASVREGRDAARRAGNHVYPDQGLLVFCGGYDTANGDQIPPPLRRGRDRQRAHGECEKSE